MHGRRDGISDFEAELAALRPAPAGVDRDGLMWRAGRASSSGAGAWRAATAACALVAVVLGVALARRPPATPAPQRAVAVRAAAPAGEAAAPVPRVASVAALGAAPLGLPVSDDSYVRLRELVLAEGVAALEARPAGPAPAPGNLEDLLEPLRARPGFGPWRSKEEG